ncbi:exonuclease 1 [Centroberyx affinis]|uniref:exonuclease 1 n=1 Tax=Centroberyx affinis TaxID=166261 RepID=UPI003A5BCB3A
MGIPGLLQFIKDASEPISVRKYKGQTVAVDTYCWLHKGAFSCAEKLAKGEPTDQYVWYCMKFVDMLLSFNVKPVLVFDGRNLPSKKEVEKARRERRQANLQKGKQLLREGKLSEARDCFTRCVNVTPAMAHEVIKAARTRGVDCVVAPYEADAQLAFLSKSGLVQAVITEDSDLLAFGCKKVILKMDKQGNGLEIDQSHLGRCRSLGDVFTEEKFRYMCILSGCDYLASLHGIGLGKACKLLKIANNPDILKVIRKMGQYLKMNVVVPEEYVEGFVKANNTFLYQLVFDPVRRKVAPLNPYPEHIDPAALSYAGHNIGDDKGLQMALGNLDLNTMERIDDFNPDKPIKQPSKPRSRGWNDSPASSRLSAGPSIWSTGFRPGAAAPPRPAASPDRPASTRGKERVVSLQGLRFPSRELQVKRPREDCGVSDQEVLQQYSSSGPKRSRPEERSGPEDKPTPTAQPSPRNRFATLLQRRNQDAEGDGQATRSRFFSSSCAAASPSAKESVQEDLSRDVETSSLNQAGESSPGTQAEDGDEPEVPSLDTPSPPPSPGSSPSPRPAGRGLGAFRWPGSSSPSAERSGTPTPASGLAALQRFQHKKQSVPRSAKAQEPPGATPPPTPSSIGRQPEDEDGPPDSPPSQDSAYFSQSQPRLASCHEEEVSTSYCFPSPSSPAHKEDAVSEMNSSNDSGPGRSPTHSPEADKKPSTMGSMVAGLPRLKPGSRAKAAKGRALGPARASGLRKKPPGSGKKAAAANNENNPGLQATISGLWKNFGFKKESQKMNPSKKGEPMSPVKQNLPANAPQTDNGMNFISSF